MAKKVKSDLQKFGLTKEVVLESLKIVVLRMKKFNQEYGDLGLRYLFSSLAEVCG